jgi:hypothetical protein
LQYVTFHYQIIKTCLSDENSSEGIEQYETSVKITGQRISNQYGLPA